MGSALTMIALVEAVESVEAVVPLRQFAGSGRTTARDEHGDHDQCRSTDNQNRNHPA